MFGASTPRMHAVKRVAVFLARLRPLMCQYLNFSPPDRRLFHCFSQQWLRVSEVAICFCKRAGASVEFLRLVHGIDVLWQLRGLRSVRL